MSKLRSNQSIFCLNIAKLISWCFEHGIEITFGEAWRPEEMQAIYFKDGRSKTMNSNHLIKLAVDLNFFVNNTLTYDDKVLKQVADYWKSLNKNNRWGGDFKEIKDKPHFEMINK